MLNFSYENATMDVRSYETGQEQKRKNKRDNESGRNHKESTGKKVEVVWGCNEKRGTLRMKKGVSNESTGEKEEKRGRPKRRWLHKVKDDIKEKGLSAEDV